MRPPQPVRQRRTGAGLSWIGDRPEVGIYLRRRREALGLTLEQVATAAATVSSLRKWEAGQRNPGIDSLTAWCRALDLPGWTLRKIISMIVGGIDTLHVGHWPPTFDTGDLDHLEMYIGPAYYLGFPSFDVLAANTTARRILPDLAPADPTALRPANLVEWVMTAPARNLLADWATVATRLVFLLRSWVRA
ncbi:helix-turn-helix domain-containing protein [Nocardia aurantia]|nr:helix-turn-helix domain-containing protein [Nocardia aurantia]